MSPEENDRAEALLRLAGEQGEQLLARAAALPADRLTRLTRLRKYASAEIATAAVQLLELRHRARTKFDQAGRMFFTQEGLEQATGDAIARYRASRFPAGVPVLDACCGIGGDAMALGLRGPVLAVDLNPAAAVCTRLNAAQAGADVRTLCADATALPPARLRDAGFQAAFFDPSRRTDRADGGRRRLRSGEDYFPPLSWLDTLCGYFPMTAVKVSPAIDDEALRRSDCRVEFLSDKGECKEAVLWCGALAAPFSMADAGPDAEPYFATALRPGAAPATLAPFTCPPPTVSEPRPWLIEPDPAVIRAHLIPQAAALFDAALLEPGIAYLTADRPAESPFAHSYRILDTLPCNFKLIQARIRTLGGRITAVKKRSAPFEPEEVQRKLQPAGDLPLVLVLTRRGGKLMALLCEPAAQNIGASSAIGTSQPRTE